MKKLITGFILIILFLFISMFIMVEIDKSNIDDMKELVYNNTKIENIEYISEYDNYYLVMNAEYLYLFNSNYEEITKIEANKLYNNKNNYELIYRNNTIMYMDNYKNEEEIIFKYYNIYTYELIDDVLLGGN